MRILNPVVIAAATIAATAMLAPAAFAASPMGSLGGEAIPSNADETLAVGSGIRPGTYTTTGLAEEADPGTFCRWRVIDANNAIRDQGQTDSEQDQQTVTIRPTDTFFETFRCAAWTSPGLFGSLGGGMN
ncbi:hypothetical protein [Rhodococcus sp. WMMA185]|uniref:hypothetical protein n=1 Tax=Rhodococcus sp. WMMA185 TaxID=679318 RepID=UPI0012F486B1|nr:hypothetical protein [Rhodococcus sp. WMMA185]